MVENARLPPPTTTIRTTSHWLPSFALLGRNKDKILVVSDDDRSRSFHVLTTMRCSKVNAFLCRRRRQPLLSLF
jgi:hypothetical protein